MADKKISQLPTSTTPLAGTEVLPVVQSGTTVQVSVNDLTAGKIIPGAGVNITSVTYQSAGTVENTNDPNNTSLLTFTNGANVNGGIAQGGGKVLSLIDKTSNSGNVQAGYGLYVSSPYDGTNASGNTYSLFKYGLYVDDIYSYYGVNDTSFPSNFGIYVKGGGKNYIKADLQIDNNLVIGTSGKGIDFSATASGSGTMTSELLSDYETGNFSPSIISGITSPTYNTLLGQYTKIGDLVYFTILIGPASGTLNGDPFRIGGLPFTSTSYDDQAAYFGYNNGLSTQATAYVLANSTSIGFASYGGGTTIVGTNLSSSAFYMRISGSYKAA